LAAEEGVAVHVTEDAEPVVTLSEASADAVADALPDAEVTADVRTPGGSKPARKGAKQAG
jgi:hypothetical protein